MAGLKLPDQWFTQCMTGKLKFITEAGAGPRAATDDDHVMAPVRSVEAPAID